MVKAIAVNGRPSLLVGETRFVVQEDDRLWLNGPGVQRRPSARVDEARYLHDEGLITLLAGPLEASELDVALVLRPGPSSPSAPPGTLSQDLEGHNGVAVAIGLEQLREWRAREAEGMWPRLRRAWQSREFGQVRELADTGLEVAGVEQVGPYTKFATVLALLARRDADSARFARVFKHATKRARPGWTEKELEAAMRQLKRELDGQPQGLRALGLSTRWVMAAQASYEPGLPKGAESVGQAA